MKNIINITRIIFFIVISAAASVVHAVPVVFEFTGRVSDGFLFYGNMVQGGYSYPEWNGKSITGQFVIDVEGLTSSPANSPYYRHYGTSLYHNVDDWLSFTLTNPDGKTYSFPGDYAFADDIDPFSEDYVNSTSAWLADLPEEKGNKFSVGRYLFNPDLQLKRYIYLSLESSDPNPSGLINGLDFETLVVDAQYANWINYGLVNYATNDGTRFDYYFTIETIKRVPEPSSLLLLVCGIAMLLWTRRRRAN